MSRITEIFGKARHQGRPVVAGFLTIGFPLKDDTVSLIDAMAEGGIDLIELGMPFSDPVADGATIQDANEKALANGVTLTYCLETCAKARLQRPEIPLMLMGYYNPLLRYGVERFVTHAQEAGIDGLIIVDLPPEEAGLVLKETLPRNIELTFLLGPTSTHERVRKIADVSTGFIYCVSLTGVTGTTLKIDSRLSEFVNRVRSETPLPLMVGFGISSRSQVEAVSNLADGVVVGSALMNLISDTPIACRRDRVIQFIRDLRGASASFKS